MRFGCFGLRGLTEWTDENGNGFAVKIRTRDGKTIEQCFPNIGQPDQSPPVHSMHKDDPEYDAQYSLIGCEARPWSFAYTIEDLTVRFWEKGSAMLFRFDPEQAIEFEFNRVGDCIPVFGFEFGKRYRSSIYGAVFVDETPDFDVFPAYGSDADSISKLPILMNAVISDSMKNSFSITVNKAWIPFISQLFGIRRSNRTLIFAWDGSFSAILLADWEPDLAKRNLAAIFENQQPDGRLPQIFIDTHPSNRSNPPIWFIAVWKIYLRTQDRDYLRSVFPVLKRNYSWFKTHRMNGDGSYSWGTDHEQDDLQVKLTGTVAAVLESGLDDSPVFDGVSLKGDKLDMACIDLTCLMMLACRLLIRMSEAVFESADEYRRDLALLDRSVHAFFDLDAGVVNAYRWDGSSKAFVPEITPTVFYPLLTGCLNTDEVALLRSIYREHFDGEWVIPSVSRLSKSYNPDGDYWRGRIWPPMNYLAALGMKRYMPEIADEMREKSRRMMQREWQRDGHVHENYSAATGFGEPRRGTYARSCPLYSWGGLLAIVGETLQGINTEND